MLAAAFACWGACDPWSDDLELHQANRDKDLYEIVMENSDISVFAQVLQATGYDRFLQEEQALTVFAPQNAALAHLNLSDTTTLKLWVQGYIAYLLYYTNEDGNFSLSGQVVESIEMLNRKTIPAGVLTLSGSNVITTNRSCKNGVLHVIDNTVADRKNIWEYLTTEQEGQAQVQFMLSLNEEVMDMNKSVQTGVDINGRPTYDTIWATQNTFLERYPLADERRSFTVVLLESSVLEALKTKYANYFFQKDAAEQEKEVFRQIASDLILKATAIDAPGRYPSLDDVLVDIDPADIIDSYQASNGRVYRLSSANIRIFQNKIKEQIIEAESGELDGQNAWMVRYRTFASGGQDIVLKGTTRQTFYTTEYFPDNDSTATYSSEEAFRVGDTYILSSVTNSYVKFKPTLYSSDYEIYWMAYDDETSHYTEMLWDSVPKVLTLEQKMLISFPGEPEVTRGTDYKITGNFSPYFVMAGVATAGVREETPVLHYRVDNSVEANSGYFLLGQPYEGSGYEFGGGAILKSPVYGEATFMIANTVRSTNANAGVMFLDYIRLVPKVDPND
jgi:hypothetical protein